MSLAAEPRATSAPFRYARFEAPLGAEIRGLDLTRPLEDATFAAVRRAFLESEGVLVLRDQRITPEQHIAFSRRFGPLAIHVLHQFLLPGHPEILLVSNVIENGKPVGLGDAGRYWHSDLSYMPEPSLGSLLHAQEIPSEGGDTSFVNMYAAYEALAPDIKHRIDGKRAIHSYRKTYDKIEGSTFRPALSAEQKAEVQEVAHPVVRTHPETGRRALFISEGFTTRILDMPEEESAELLAHLFGHATSGRFSYRHRWQPHDIVFWDNRCVIHFAHGCPPELRRHMHRTTVKGDVPR
ncbi:MAG TPA: TauD/TfdA family dioxygenase [Stellaceae bacterium]|nr:TauD/TfdA family dioxygenase [Stellaceae bacterium]